MRPATVLSFVFMTVLTPAAASAAQQFDLPDGPGRELVYGNCQTCHDLQSVVDSSGIPRNAWNAVLDNMKGFGLRISADQRAKILDYLGTYMGPKPPPAAAGGSAEVVTTADGAQVYADTCVACHQEGGKGKPGEFPPFAGNPDLFLATDFPARVALHGLEGKIEAEGQKIDGAMPSFDFLSDDEIAAVVKYIRSNFGNDAIRPAGFADVTPAEIAALRAKPMTPAEVYAYRASLKK